MNGMILSEIGVFATAASGWLTALLQWKKHRSKRPVVAFRSLQCVADHTSESIVIQGTVINKGAISAKNCTVQYFVYNPESKRVVDRGKAAWIKPSSQDPLLQELSSLDQCSFRAEYTIYPTPIVTGDPDPALIYLFPTESNLRRFYMYVVLTFGPNQRIYKRFSVDVTSKIHGEMTPSEALSMLKVQRTMLPPNPAIRQMLDHEDTVGRIERTRFHQKTCSR